MADQKKMSERCLAFNGILETIEHPEATVKYPALIPIAQSLRKKIEKVKKLDFHQSRTKGSEIKKGLRHSLAVVAHSVSCGVYSYAQVNGLVALRNAVKYSYSDFYRPVESTMIGRCRQVLNAVKKVKNPLHYALTPGVIEKFREELEKYIKFMHKPSLSVKQHARMYRQAEHLLDQCLELIREQLDPLMVTIGYSDKSFAGKYYLWRRIRKPAGRKRKYIKSQKAKQVKLLSVTPVTESVKPAPQETPQNQNA
jgi:hypothetical protein